MRRVLIVSPHFPPVNAPDMQRVRLALPHLRSFAWEPTVLVVDPAFIEGPVLEPLLEKTYPADIRIQRVGGLLPGITRRFGVGSLWWRCGRSLRRAGDRLLSTEPFDLVFFSTTQFDAFTLGPRWRRHHRTPYVLDYQDPWVNDYYRLHRVLPPGGPLKFWLSQFTARRREPTAVRQAAAIVAVSDAYEADLRRRYPDLPPGCVHHLPFGTEPDDLRIALDHPPPAPLIPFGDGRRHLVYTGRVGADMTPALTLLFRALRLHLDSAPDSARNLMLHFIGTDYAPPPLGRHWVKPIAETEGVSSLVHEHPRRVPYFESLFYLARADGLLLTGSNDPTYSASKLFPYLAAKRPLLVLAHEKSLMFETARAQGVSTAYGFDATWEEPERQSALIRLIQRQWFAPEDLHPVYPDETHLARYSASGMSKRLAAIFDSAVSPAQAN